MSESTAYSMNTMLKEVIRSGTGTRANIGRPAVGKTGTTQLPEEFEIVPGIRTLGGQVTPPDIVGVVWMGFDRNYSDNGTPQYMVNVFGGQYPATVWKQIVQVALEDVPESDWERPENYSYGTIDTSSGGSESERDTSDDEQEEENNEDDTTQILS